jgi:predicted RNA-binding Zn ribbon-like protein
MATHSDTLSLVGGVLCLDFCNTAGDHATEHPSEWLTSYEELVAWSRHAGALTEAGADRLLTNPPESGAGILQYARDLRETLFRIFAAHARGETPPEGDLQALNAALREGLPPRSLARAGNSYRWVWSGTGEEPDRMLWPVLTSAAELLLSPELQRVKECGGAGCGWLFLDVSRNRSRRWCDMADCGNRAKARRHYQRARAG